MPDTALNCNAGFVTFVCRNVFFSCWLYCPPRCETVEVPIVSFVSWFARFFMMIEMYPGHGEKLAHFNHVSEIVFSCDTINWFNFGVGDDSCFEKEGCVMGCPSASLRFNRPWHNFWDNWRFMFMMPNLVGQSEAAFESVAWGHLRLWGRRAGKSERERCLGEMVATDRSVVFFVTATWSNCLFDFASWDGVWSWRAWRAGVSYGSR